MLRKKTKDYVQYNSRGIFIPASMLGNSGFTAAIKGDMDKMIEAQEGQKFKVDCYESLNKNGGLNMSENREITYSTGETEKLTGASHKQIRYWIERGHVHSDRNVCGLIAYHRFNNGQVELIRKIKGYLEQGYTLARAAELALTTKQSH